MVTIHTLFEIELRIPQITLDSLVVLERSLSSTAEAETAESKRRGTKAVKKPMTFIAVKERLRFKCRTWRVS